jgi:hypothetical protein
MDKVSSKNFQGRGLRELHAETIGNNRINTLINWPISRERSRANRPMLGVFNCWRRAAFMPADRRCDHCMQSVTTILSPSDKYFSAALTRGTLKYIVDHDAYFAANSRIGWMAGSGWPHRPAVRINCAPDLARRVRRRTVR